MDIRLSGESAHGIESRRPRAGCRTLTEFVEMLLRRLRQAEGNTWLRAQEALAAEVWGSDAGARSDAR